MTTTQRAFPGFENLYFMEDPVSDRVFRWEFEDFDSALPLSLGEITPAKPIRVSRAMGSAIPGDIVWTTAVAPLVVSQQILSLLESHQLSGWKNYPVAVIGKNGNPSPGYHGLAISGRTGPVDLKQSAIQITKYPGGFFPDFRGHFFDPSTWSGDDFCIEEGTSFRIVTQRVVDMFRKHHISNALFVRLTEFVCSTGNFPPGDVRLPADLTARIRAAYLAAGAPVPPEYFEVDGVRGQA